VRKSRKIIASKCGHETRLKGEVTAFGQTITTEMGFGGKPEYCLECLGSMAIKCAWCEKPIFIGDPVTAKLPLDPEFKLPEGAVAISDHPLQVIGCLGSDCTDTIAERAGFWVPGEDGKGHLERTRSIFEQAMHGSAVVQDIGSMAEAQGR
jgi:hypothetical protein